MYGSSQLTHCKLADLEAVEQKMGVRHLARVFAHTHCTLAVVVLIMGVTRHARVHTPLLA